MSNLTELEDRRAHLVASLEYGTSPLLGRDMYAKDEEEL